MEIMSILIACFAAAGVCVLCYSDYARSDSREDQ
jgi:hypothetical protein